MEEQAMQELLRLTRENNHMLHSMRRNARLAGVVKFIFYILILVVAPLWVYSTYLQPLVGQMQRTMNQIQGTNASAQAQFLNFEQLFKQLGSKFGGGSTSTGQ
jgi:hypothetical protein